MKFGLKNVVKNIVEAVFPVNCRGCGEVGGFVCERCKKYISENMKAWRAEERGVFDAAEYLGFRDEILGELVEECKYGPARGLAVEIAEVVWRGYFEQRLDDWGGGSFNGRVLKKLGAKTFADLPLVLVPMPTSRKHVRERGFDHMDLICREVARQSGGLVRRARLLERAKDTVQVGTSGEVRRRQAKEAVRMNPKFLGEDGKVLDEFRGCRVVLMDDVWTTGASMLEAGKILAKAGVGSGKGGSLLAVTITKNRSHKRPVIRHGEIE